MQIVSQSLQGQSTANSRELEKDLIELEAKLIDKKLVSAQVQKMLGSYPDYGKATPHYVASLTDVFESFSLEVREVLTSPIHGLLSKHSFLPSIAETIALGKQIEGKLKFDVWRAMNPTLSKQNQKYIELVLTDEERANRTKVLKELTDSFKKEKDMSLNPLESLKNEEWRTPQPPSKNLLDYLDSRNDVAK